MTSISFRNYRLSRIFGLFLCSTTVATSSLYANAAQIILRDKDNYNCALDVPALGSGVTYQYEMKAVSSKCKTDFRARSIEFIELPSAVKIFLADDFWCSESTSQDEEEEEEEGKGKPEKNTRNFWIKLKTTKKSTSVGGNGSTQGAEVHYLLTYGKNSFIGPGLLLEDKYQRSGSQNLDKLSCIKLTASANINTPPVPAAATGNSRLWAASQKENESRFSCSGNAIMTGRLHYGDENKTTSIECATASQAGTAVIVRNKVWSEPLKESGVYKDDVDGKRYHIGKYYVCPPNTIMTGRQHKGDENADTWYECATATNAGRDLSVTPHEWSEEKKESGSEFHCPANQFLVGRWHVGDENNVTRYRCATLQ